MGEIVGFEGFSSEDNRTFMWDKTTSWSDNFVSIVFKVSNMGSEASILLADVSIG
jgi:hypothetical protein